MKSIFAAGLILLCTAAQSQEIIGFTAYCLNGKDLESLVGKYDELPFVRGTSKRSVDGTDIDITTILYINQKTLTFTLVENVAPEKYCIISMGTKLEPFPSNQRDAIIKQRSNSRL